MPVPDFNVLFVCIGNSARSLLAEALMTTMSKGRFKGHSAGLHPGGLINPFTVELIAEFDYPLHELRSKRWTEFTLSGAITLDYVIEICCDRNNQPLPKLSWPGTPLITAWCVEDPTVVTGSIENKRAVFRRVFGQIESRIALFLDLPHTTASRAVLEQDLEELEHQLALSQAG